MAEATTEQTRSVAARDVERGMVLRFQRGDAKVVGAVNTSSARRSVVWRFEDGHEDSFTGSPDRSFTQVVP